MQESNRELGINPQNFDVEAEKDCALCTQPLGSNPDCDTCARAAGWTSQERQTLIDQRRAQDRQFGLGKRRRSK